MLRVDSALRAFVASIVAALVLGACGGSTPKIAKLDRGAIVLAFGDSITFGTGAARQQSFPAILGRDTGLQVVNGGVPGEVSADGLARLPEAIEESQPKLLILCHGGNDFLLKKDEAAVAANIRAMVDVAKSRGIAVVLLATPKPGFPPSVPKFYAEIAAVTGIPIEGDVLKSVLLDSGLKSDLVHPNGKGYGAIATAVGKLLKKSGAI
ncbi:MAG TPA: GDSL-type esterase/lipase family protein [Usitatibacter sp.]